MFSYHRDYYQPQLILNEAPLSKEPICMVMAEGQEALPVASRICFGTLQSAQYNIQVKDIGYVHPKYLSKFSNYWDMEHARVPDMIPHYRFCSSARTSRSGNIAANESSEGPPVGGVGDQNAILCESNHITTMTNVGYRESTNTGACHK
jgi:hypothetical protein